jgi:hypothetical protein
MQAAEQASCASSKAMEGPTAAYRGNTAILSLSAMRGDANQDPSVNVDGDHSLEEKAGDRRHRRIPHRVQNDRGPGCSSGLLEVFFFFSHWQ